MKEQEIKTKEQCKYCRYCNREIEDNQKGVYSCGSSHSTTKDFFCNERHYINWVEKKQK